MFKEAEGYVKRERERETGDVMIKERRLRLKNEVKKRDVVRGERKKKIDEKNT